MECGRQDSNLHRLAGSPLRALGSSSTGFQSQRVCQFRHARSVVFEEREGRSNRPSRLLLDNGAKPTPSFRTQVVLST